MSKFSGMTLEGLKVQCQVYEEQLQAVQDALNSNILTRNATELKLREVKRAIERAKRLEVKVGSKLKTRQGGEPRVVVQETCLKSNEILIVCTKFWLVTGRFDTLNDLRDDMASDKPTYVIEGE